MGSAVAQVRILRKLRFRLEVLVEARLLGELFSK